MYRYSPIKKIFIKNFRNIGEATIDFTESPIVSLIGENEQGKTSIVKAIGVCAMHATPRDQKDYIRDGTKGFGVAIELEDGTQVVRMKMASANSYKVVYPKDEDGEPVKPNWETNKIDSGLPKAVQEVMGMIEEPETKEFLHIRTYEDQLLFVTTASSANYKVMYNALQISQLVDAIKLGSKEANAYKASIGQTEVSVETLQSKANELRILDIEPLQNIRDRVSKERAQLEFIEKAIKIKRKLDEQIESLGELSKIQDLNEISVSQATTLSGIDKTVSKIQKLENSLAILSDVDTLQFIETPIEDKLKAAINRLSQIKASKKESEILLKADGLSDIKTESVVKAQKGLEISSKIKKYKRKLSTVDISADEIPDSSISVLNKISAAKGLIAKNSQNRLVIAQAEKYCEQITHWFKAIGINVETCPNCGEAVVINVESIG